jgi:hypothetical protein
MPKNIKIMHTHVEAIVFKEGHEYTMPDEIADQLIARGKVIEIKPEVEKKEPVKEPEKEPEHKKKRGG